MAKISKQEYAAPSDRVFTEWTPDRVKLTFLRAEGGSLRSAADLCDTLLVDDRISGALGPRVLGLLGLPFKFEPAEGAARRTPIIKASERDWWEANPESELGQVLRWGIFFGLGPGELVWQDDPQTGRVLPRLKFWHPRHLRIDPETRQWFITTTAGEVPFTPGDGHWVLYAPYGLNRPWAQAPWRACGAWWLLKEYARQDWATYSEQHGNPIKVGEAPDTASKEARRDLAADLSSLGGDTAIALPPGYSMKLIEATANTWANFKAQIDLADSGMAIAVAGQNLTSKVQGASLAATDVHNTIRLDLIESDGESLASTLRDQQWTWWCEFNFGDRRVCPWPKWDTTPPADLKELAGTLNTAATALKSLQDLGIDIDPLLERFNLARAKDPPPTPTPAPPPQPDAQASARRAQLAARPSKVPSGVIVCLVPPPDVAATLAIDGGEAAGELHLTLGFFGTTDELGDAQLEKLLTAVQVYAEAYSAGSLTASINGLGRFSLPQKDALLATVDAPALLDLRDGLLRTIDHHSGLMASELHGFTPHITLAYLAQDQDSPISRLTPLDTQFTELQIWAGPARHAFTLGSDQHRGRLPPQETP